MSHKSQKPSKLPKAEARALRSNLFSQKVIPNRKKSPKRAGNRERFPAYCAKNL